MNIIPRTMTTSVPRKLQECDRDREVEDCLLSIADLSLGVPNNEACIILENQLLQTFACFQKCDTFDCAADADDVFDKSGTKVDQLTLCGGVDVVATCNSGSLISNGVESTVPKECLLDAEIEECIIGANNAEIDINTPNLNICEAITNQAVDFFSCLQKCETFSCENLGEEYFESVSNFASLFSCKEDFEGKCEASMAGEGLRAGLGLLMLVGVFSLRLIS